LGASESAGTPFWRRVMMRPQEIDG
jgi:hypothetical protein